MTSKYMGETEKNLSALLSRAERTEAVLLFDEADALFGKRTDVRESNDRFANAQTNYLLQRIETFEARDPQRVKWNKIPKTLKFGP